MQQNNPTPLIFNFPQSVTKLNKGNILVWHAQIVPYLQGHDLYGFVDYTNSPPNPNTSTATDGSLTITTNLDTLWWAW